MFSELFKKSKQSKSTKAENGLTERKTILGSISCHHNIDWQQCKTIIGRVLSFNVDVLIKVVVNLYL